MEIPILINSWSFASIAVVFLLVVISSVATALIYSLAPYTIKIATPLFLSLIFNIAVLVSRVATNNRLVTDEISWHLQGQLAAEGIIGLKEFSSENLTEGKEGYAWLVGSLYAIAGPTPLLPIILNILLFALLVPTLAVVTGIAAEALNFTDVDGIRAVKFVAYFIAVTPTIVYWSPRMLREIISMFLISFSVLCVMMLLRTKKSVYLIGAVVAVALMFTIRAQVGAALAAGLLMGLVVALSLNVRGSINRVFLVLSSFLLLFSATWSYVDSTADLSVANTAYRNRALAGASSAFSGVEEVRGADSITDIVLFNLPRVLLGPFLNELNFSPVMLFAASSNIFWLGSLIIAFRIFVKRGDIDVGDNYSATARGSRWWAVLVLVTILSTLVVMLSINAGNYGLVIRMRLMPFVVLIPLSGIGYALFFRRGNMKPRAANFDRLHSRSASSDRGKLTA